MNRDALRERLAKIEGLKTGADLLRERTEQKNYTTDALPGAEVANDSGTYHLAETRIALDVRHGDFQVGALLEIVPDKIALAARLELSDLNFRSAVFLDTETTSLESGAGVHVFMIGVGFFEKDAFVVRQYFMRNPAEEVAMLSDLGELLARFEIAVSFFGKNFDLPRIVDRFNINRLPLNFPPVHIDLCHTGRRIWKGLFGNCQLQTLERGILKFVRSDDLPGADCPQAYFNYLRGFPSRINDVFEHNLYDVISMAVLPWAIDQAMTDSDRALVLANVARVYAEADRTEAAVGRYEMALEMLWPPTPRTQAAVVMVTKGLAAICWRQEDWERATRLWQELVDHNLGGAYPHERLAIYYEHTEHDYEMAIERARDAYGFAVREGSESAQVALRVRIQRLEAKCAAAEAAGG